MKRLSVLAIGAIVALCALSGATSAAQLGRVNDRVRGDQVCVYKDINYFGAEQCYKAGEEINNLGVQNNSISSIRVYGGATVTVYEKQGFGGHSEQFTSDVSDLGKRLMEGKTGWSDRIVSLRIAGNPATSSRNDNRNDNRTDSGTYRRNQNQQPRDGICVYDRPNYEGRSDCWNQGENIADLSRRGDWSGGISSIRLFGARTVAVVYQDADFRGETLTVDHNIPDLSTVPGRRRGNGNGNGNNGNGNGRGNGNSRNFNNWDRQISSVQVRAQDQRR